MHHSRRDRALFRLNHDVNDAWNAEGRLGKTLRVPAEVRHNSAESRYELTVDGDLVGVADYTATENALDFSHTEIVPERRDKGLGAILVRGALDDVRLRGGRIVASCWFVAAFIDENPTYADLLA